MHERVILPLVNATNLLSAIEERKVSRDEAKLIAFMGRSGIGKTQAALYCAAHAGAAVVRPLVSKDSALIALILEQLDLYNRSTGRYSTGRRDMPVQERVLLAVDYLKETGTPLIIDEAGSLGDAQLSLLRKMADRTNSVIVLVGESGERARRCDDLSVRLNGIYNLQRRCYVVEAVPATDVDVDLIAESFDFKLTDDLRKCFEGKTPAKIVAALSNDNLRLGGSLSEAALREVLK